MLVWRQPKFENDNLVTMVLGASSAALAQRLIVACARNLYPMLSVDRLCFVFEVRGSRYRQRVVPILETDAMIPIKQESFHEIKGENNLGNDILRRAIQLVKNECACTIDRKNCEWLDKPCPQIAEFQNCGTRSPRFCSWFRDAVLPSDKTLQARLTGLQNEQVRKCSVCNTPILRSSNRQRFCDACGQRNRRKVHASTMRASRARQHSSKNVTL